MGGGATARAGAADGSRGAWSPILAAAVAAAVASAVCLVPAPRVESTMAAGPTVSAAPTVPPGRLLRVPTDLPTLEAAIDAAQPGDVIQLDPGTYDGGVLVRPEKHDLTIRGTDRNRVVFDGRGRRLTAIEVQADRVTLENLSAHDYDGNGFYWEGVEGFTGRYLTVWNVSLYGIYATESRGGLFERSLVSGAADAAFYIGECQPCDTVIREVDGRLSAVGYSGTNTGDGLELRASTWDRNGTGILPNSYEGQALPPPEHGSRIEDNVIRDSGTVPVPAHSPLAGFIGLGIGIAGGQDNIVTGNEISGSAAYGIALFPTLQQSGDSWLPNGNQIRDNVVSSSGTADLGAAEGTQVPSCFSGNRFKTSLPAAIETAMPCDGTPTSDGDSAVSQDLAIPIPVALDRLEALGPRPDWRQMPAPEPATTSPDPLPAGLRSFGSSGPFTPEVALGLIGLVALVAVLLAVWRLSRRRS